MKLNIFNLLKCHKTAKKDTWSENKSTFITIINQKQRVHKSVIPENFMTDTFGLQPTANLKLQDLTSRERNIQSPITQTAPPEASNLCICFSGKTNLSANTNSKQ